MIKTKDMRRIDSIEIEMSKGSIPYNLLLEKIIEKTQEEAKKYGLDSFLEITKEQIKLEQGLFSSKEQCISCCMKSKQSLLQYIILPRQYGIYQICTIYEIIKEESLSSLKTYWLEDAFGSINVRVHMDSNQTDEEQQEDVIFLEILLKGIYQAKKEIESLPLKELSETKEVPEKPCQKRYKEQQSVKNATIPFIKEEERSVEEAVEQVRIEKLKCSKEDYQKIFAWASYKIGIQHHNETYQDNLVRALNSLYLPQIDQENWPLDTTAFALIMAYDSFMIKNKLPENVFPMDDIYYYARNSENLASYKEAIQNELDRIDTLNRNYLPRNIVKTVAIGYYYLFYYQMGYDKQGKEDLKLEKEKITLKEKEPNKSQVEEETIKNTLDYFVKENEREFLFEILLPGIEKEDIHILYEDGTISITIENKHQERAHHLSQNLYGKTMQYFVGEIIENKIYANLKNGILNLVLIKRKRKNKRFKIIIK